MAQPDYTCVPMFVRSAALNEANRFRAGLLAFGVRSEATGVKARVGVEIESEELGEHYTGN